MNGKADSVLDSILNLFLILLYICTIQAGLNRCVHCSCRDPRQRPRLAALHPHRISWSIPNLGIDIFELNTLSIINQTIGLQSLILNITNSSDPRV